MQGAFNPAFACRVHATQQATLHWRALLSAASSAARCTGHRHEARRGSAPAACPRVQLLTLYAFTHRLLSPCSGQHHEARGGGRLLRALLQEPRVT